MAALAARDAERVLRFVADAEELGGDHPFAPRVLEQMAKLVGADWAGYHERDAVRKRHLLDLEHPSLRDSWAGISWCGVAGRDNPLERRRAARQVAATRLSSLVSRRALERALYCREILEPEWLESGLPTLARRIGDRRLTVDRCGDALLLEEARDQLRLTPRERQILRWVARGKTNVQIAEALWISPSTVRKHLENVYAKLGVRTRTAAVTRFLGVLDDES